MIILKTETEVCESLYKGKVVIEMARAVIRGIYQMGGHSVPEKYNKDSEYSELTAKEYNRFIMGHFA